MLKNITCGLLLSLMLFAGLAMAEDGPTLDQVYKAAESGKLDEAQKMMDVVLKSHPNSAKAHFVEAELLAKQGQLGRAESELNTAERLKPGLPFAKPQAVQDLKNRIATTHRVSQSQYGSSQSHYGNNEESKPFPWGMLLLGVGAIAVLFFIIRAMTARNQGSSQLAQGGYQANGMRAQAPMQPYGGGMGPSYGGQAPMGGQRGAPMAAGGGRGSGSMGGLATGAAVGVGMVAGEALAHHFMDGNHSAAPTAAAPVADSWADSSGSMGGNDFGIADNSSWGDDSNIASSDGGGSDWG